eukprot:10557068-Alexandrium_andersonii.AAC.1
MATFVFNRSPGMFARAMEILRANREWKSLHLKFDFSWAVKLGHHEPVEGRMKPNPNDYCHAWDVYCEAFEFSRNAIPWPRGILMRLTAVARRDRTIPACYSSGAWTMAVANPTPDEAAVMR